MHRASSAIPARWDKTLMMIDDGLNMTMMLNGWVDSVSGAWNHEGLRLRLLLLKFVNNLVEVRVINDYLSIQLSSSLQVSRRMGFTAIPYAVLLIKIVGQCVTLSGWPGVLFASLGYLCLCTFKLLVSWTVLLQIFWSFKIDYSRNTSGIMMRNNGWQGLHGNQLVKQKFPSLAKDASEI